jgi:hypothetical protein
LHEIKNEGKLPKMHGKWWEFYLRKYENLVPEILKKELDVIFTKKYSESDSEDEFSLPEKSKSFIVSRDHHS